MDRKFRVVRKFKEETEKGWKYGIRLSNVGGNNLTLYFDSESEMDSYQIQDDLAVKILNPQTTLVKEK